MEDQFFTTYRIIFSKRISSNNTWRQIIVTPAMFMENITKKNTVLINNQYIYKILVLQNQKMIRIV